MMERSHPEAVIFDCDGVLLDSEYLCYDALMHVLGPMGIHVAREEVFQFLGTTPPLIEVICEARGIPMTAEMLEAYRAKRRWQHEHCLEAMPDALSLVERIAVPKAVASGSSVERLRLTLQPTGFWDHFAPHIYSAADQPNGKPAPDVYLHAAQQISVPPAHCLVIEDSGNGVKAGNAAGMTVWGFAGGKHCHAGHAAKLRDAGAAEIFETMAAVRAAIQSRLPHLLKA